MDTQQQRTVIVPRYVTRFACIAGACEDTCCAGWRVDLDKSSYDRYQNTTDPVLRPMISQCIKKHADSPSATLYGYITSKDSLDNSCSFLNPDNLCLIQQRLGESALSGTCADFPRVFNRIGEQVHMALTMACPEAARLALLADDAFEFTSLQLSVKDDRLLAVPFRKGLESDCIHEVHVFLFQIMRTVGMPLREKLAVVGLVCERLQKLMEKQHPESIPDLLRAVDSVLANGTLLAPLEEGVERLDLQAKVACAFFHERRSSTVIQRHKDLLNAIGEALGLFADGTVNPALFLKAYEAGMGRMRSDALAQRIMERYLLNEMLRECFPWKEGNPLRHYTSLLIRFTVLRLMMVGRAVSQNEPLSGEQWVETVQVFARKYSHAPDFLESIHRSFQETTWERLDQLYQLL